jgi:hypothetical protein
MSPGESFTTGAIEYDLDETKPLLIAVYFNPGSGASGVRCNRNVPPEQAMAYYKLGQEASTPNRTGYTAYPGVYFIESIEAW